MFPAFVNTHSGIKLLSGKKFNAVIWENMGDTIARIEHRTGILRLNPDIWPRLKPHFRRFFELHEYGHWVLKTDSEELASKYAIDNFLRLQTYEQDLRDLNEITSWLANVKLKRSDNRHFSDIAPILLGSIITGAVGLFSTASSGSQAKKNRDALNQQSKLAAETELKSLAQQQEILKLQADLQNDKQDAEQKQIILIGGIIGGLVILGLIALTVKALLK